MSHRIALIGFGAIGADVAAGLSRQDGPYLLAALCRRPDAPLPDTVHRLRTLDDMLAWRPDLVVEVAGQQAVGQYAERCLHSGVPFVVTSVGALADRTVCEALRDAARAGRARVIVPSGAVASLDYLNAVKRNDGLRVSYESRKPAAAWTAELTECGYDPTALREAVVLYEGDAATAAQKYPKNLNVAATLALAGVGMEATKVKVVADPSVVENQHTIDVSSPLGTLTTKLVNQPSPTNPKTSWVVAQSVIATVDRYFSPIVVG